jgi:hypothetical protein
MHRLRISSRLVISQNGRMRLAKRGVVPGSGRIESGWLLKSGSSVLNKAAK